MSIPAHTRIDAGEMRRLELRADIRARSLATIVRQQVAAGQPIEGHPLFADVLDRFIEADDEACVARGEFLAAVEDGRNS